MATTVRLITQTELLQYCPNLKSTFAPAADGSIVRVCPADLVLNHYVVLLSTPPVDADQLVVVKHVGVDLPQRVVVLIKWPNPKFGVAGRVGWFLAEPEYATFRAIDPSGNGICRAAYKVTPEIMRETAELTDLATMLLHTTSLVPMYTPYIKQRLPQTTETAKAVIECGLIPDYDFKRSEDVTTAAVTKMLASRTVLPMPATIVSLAAGLFSNAMVPVDPPHTDGAPSTVRDDAKALWPASVRKPGDMYVFMRFEVIPKSIRGRMLLRPMKPAAHQFEAFGYPPDAVRVAPEWCLRWSDVDLELLTGMLAEGYRRIAYEHGGGKVSAKKAAAAGFVGITPMIQRVEATIAEDEIRKERAGKPKHRSQKSEAAVEELPPTPMLNGTERFLFETVLDLTTEAEAKRAAFHASALSLDNAPPCIRSVVQHGAKLKNIGRYSTAMVVEHLRRGCGISIGDIEDMVAKPLVAAYAKHHGADQGHKMELQMKGSRTSKKNPWLCRYTKGLGSVGVELVCEHQTGNDDNVAACCGSRVPIGDNPMPTQETAHPALVWATTMRRM